MLEEATFALMSDRERFWESMLRVLRGVIAALLLVVSRLVHTHTARVSQDIAW